MKCTKIQSVWKYAIMGICLLAVIITSMACQQRPMEQNLRLEDYFQAASSQMMPPENPISNVNTVLFSPHGDLPPIVDAAPTHGEALMNDHLAQEVAKEENKDRYFSVTIDIIYFDFIEKYLKDAHEEYMTLCSDPAILKYESEYKLWLDTIYQPTTEDISMIEEKGDTDVLRPKFNAYWAETQPEDVQQSYLNAESRRKEGWNKYLNIITNTDDLKEHFSKDIKVETQTELDRMKGLGYCLELQKNASSNGLLHGTLVGYLTGEQIANFSCSPAHGYYITWNGQ